MQPVAVRIIREEHTAIAAVLHSLEYVVQKLQEGAEPNFQLLNAMLEYIVEYPERCHHPKENRCLFKILKERNPSTSQLIAQLESEHAQGDELLGSLKKALTRYRSVGRSALRPFAEAVSTYAEFHWQHMTKEEDVLLPIAKRSLSDSDWQEIADAFLQNDNPLIGLRPKEHFAQLFDRILNLTPKATSMPSEDRVASRDA